MSNIILVYGESGSGKSFSTINLPPKETFIIETIRKSLPYRDWKKHYGYVDVNAKDKKENAEKNMIVCDNSDNICRYLLNISTSKPEIKHIVIDDYQYVMCNEFMRRATEKGYEKFSQIGQNAWNIIVQASCLRDDLKVYFLSHSDIDSNGKTRVKTIGRMLEEKVCLEGMFVMVLYATKIEGKHVFLTQGTETITAKSPHEMFDSDFIDNDLMFVSNKIDEYEKSEDISQ